jgi:soluble epoxide hydrolase/lipid-phosphate phosphatase
VCTPCTAPSKDFVSTEDRISSKAPCRNSLISFHLASDEAEKSVKDEQSIRQFLKGMYSGAEKGVQAENLSVIGESGLLL